MSAELRIAYVGSLLVALICAATAFADDGVSEPLVRSDNRNYLYLDCANDYFAPVLVGCGELSISADLRNLHFRRFFEADLSTERDENYLVLRSEHVPIVVPRQDYGKKDSWVYAGRKYFKYKENVRTLEHGKTADAIVVVGRIESLGGADKVTSADSRDAMKNIVLVFRYNPSRGVEAVGVTENAGSKEVYYCSERPCLFATER